jgi:hypothetical protein
MTELFTYRIIVIIIVVVVRKKIERDRGGGSKKNYPSRVRTPPDQRERAERRAAPVSVLHPIRGSMC